MAGDSSLRRIAFKIASQVAGYLRDLVYEEGLEEAIGRGAAGDITRKADKIAEEMIIDLIRAEGLCASIITEEGGSIRLCNKPEYSVIVDPLDGSMNYLSKIPYASVSIAISKYSSNASSLLVGAISNIFLRETYSFDDDGVYIDNTLVNPSNIKPSPSNIVVVYTKNSWLLDTLKGFFRSIGLEARLRVLGSASLEIVYTGLGRILLFINDMGSLRNLDIVAAVAIARKLGKTVAGLNGEKIVLKTNSIHKISSIVVGDPSLAGMVIDYVRRRARG